MLPQKTKREEDPQAPPPVRKFGHCLTFPSAAPPPLEESKPLVQDLSEPTPKVHYLEDRRFSHEHHIIAVGAIFIFIALAGIVVVFSLRHEDDEDPIYAAIPGALPPQDEAPDSPEKIIKEAIGAFLSGDKERANQLVAEVDLTKTSSSLGWELAGLLKEGAGDKQAAMETYTRGIEIAPSEGLYYRRAIMQRNIGKLDLALKDMDSAISTPPVHPLISNERLLLLIQMGRKDQARAEIQALKEQNSDRNGYIFGLCGMALQNGEYKEAGRLLASAKQSAVPAEFQQILKNPVLSSYQARPELMPFYFSNLTK